MSGTNLNNLDRIQLVKAPNGTFWYVNGNGAWQQFTLDGGGNFVQTVTGDPVDNTDPFNPVINLANGVGEAIGLEATDAMPNGGTGKVNFGVTTTGVLQTKTAEGVQQFYAPTGNVKVYKALLTQSGTDAPVATVLQNTLGGNIVWSYNGVGEYTGTLNEAFLNNKTFKIIEQEDTFGGVVLVNRINDNEVKIFTNFSNDILSQTSILIEVYP